MRIEALILFPPRRCRPAGLALAGMVFASAIPFFMGAAPSAHAGSTFSREDLDAPAPLHEKERGVLRESLDPVLSPDGTGMPYELWSGLTPEALAQSIAQLELPPRSRTLNALWRKLIASDGAAAGGSPAHFTALRVEALDQSGLIDDAAAVLAKNPASERDPLLSALTARSEIGLGNAERGCEIGKGLVGARASLPKPIQADALVISGYCALARGDTAAAALQASLIRDLDLSSSTGADLLDAVAAGLSPQIPQGAKLTLVDYRIASLNGGFSPGNLLGSATPGLIAGLAHDPRTPPDLRLAAGEAAAALNILPASDLAPLYRAAGAGGDAGTIERAGLFKSAEAERTPLKKARLIRTFLDEARRGGFYWTALQLMADPAQALEPVPEIGWFAETAIEINLASGNFDAARRWAVFGGSADSLNPAAAQPLAHWIALIDLADPAAGQDRGRGLGAVETMIHSGRFNADLLHRFTTALDALDLAVPMSLWDVASRTPQPAGGHLPDTGVLSELADASRKKEFGRTVLLVMRTLGPSGAEGAHMIALGDTLRALKRAGLEPDARQLAVEGLFAVWPRAVSQ